MFSYRHFGSSDHLTMVTEPQTRLDEALLAGQSQLFQSTAFILGPRGPLDIHECRAMPLPESLQKVATGCFGTARFECPMSTVHSGFE